MSYFSFFLKNWKVLSFGIFLTIFSGFGQSFFFGIFNPDIRAAFDISQAEFGRFYATATFCSGVLLFFFGGKIDHVPVKRFTLLACTGFLVGCALWVVSPTLLPFFIGLFLLRCIGQGIFPHIAKVFTARAFTKGRGKGMSVVLLGHPLGEAVLPIIFLGLATLFGWRDIFILVGLSVLFILIPMTIFVLNRHNDLDKNVTALNTSPADLVESKHVKELLKDWRFIAIIATSLVLPFVGTSIFLFPDFFIMGRGFSIELFASSFVISASTKFLSSLVAGAWIDKISARVLLPIFLIPMVIGMSLFLIIDHWVMLPILFATIGMTDGPSAPIINSYWPETYGTKFVGSIKAFHTSMMIFSTALAPLTIGFLIDQQMNSGVLLGAFAAFGVVGCLFALMVQRKAKGTTEKVS